MQTATKQLWAIALAAGMGSPCCVALLVLLMLGTLLCMDTAFAASPHTVTLAVENTTCGNCPIVVRKALGRVPRGDRRRY